MLLKNRQLSPGKKHCPFEKMNNGEIQGNVEHTHK